MKALETDNLKMEMITLRNKKHLSKVRIEITLQIGAENCEMKFRC